jgi:hypothetical protein
MSVLPKRHWRRAVDEREWVEAHLSHQVELPTHDLGTPEPSWWLQVRVRFSADASERRLADGANPLASPQLALRARQLVDRRTRRSLAFRIKMIVRSAEETVPDPQAAVLYDLAAVRAAADDLCALADGLLDRRTVAERGVAMTSMLLRDGYGPIYNPSAPLPLRYCVRMALLCLDP